MSNHPRSPFRIPPLIETHDDSVAVPIPPALVERIRELTEGVEVDLDKPLNPEDE